MFWKLKKATILISRDRVQVYVSDSTSPLIFVFPAPIVRNLELIDQIGFEKALILFFEQSKIIHMACSLLLDEQYVFWKRVAQGTEEQTFFDLIPLPLDQQVHKKSPLDADIMYAAYNGALIDSIQRALHQARNTVASLLPFYAFPAFDSGKVDVLLIDEKTIRKSCRYDSDILFFNDHWLILPPPLVVGVLALLIIGGASAYYYSTKSKNIVEPVVKEVQKTPSPTPTIAFLNATDIRIDIQNGTPRVGEAGRLQLTLEKKAYTVSSVGNAEIDIVQTRLDSKKTVPGEYLSGLKKILEETYVVSSASSTISESTTSADIVITIGTQLSQ